MNYKNEAVFDLANSIYQTKALNNKFYELWMSKKLNHQQLVIFAINFYEHVAPTVDRLCLSFMKSNDTEIRKKLVENMADEIGIDGRAHPELLKEFLCALLEKTANKNISFEEIPRSLINKATINLIEGGSDLFFHEHPAVACGAVLAQEWHAYPQLVNLYEGARNYMSLFELEDFHDKCEYFYIHIGSAEKEHKKQSVWTAARCVIDEETFNLLKFGFDSYVNLLSEYWDSLYHSIVGNDLISTSLAATTKDVELV